MKLMTKQIFHDGVQ